VREVGVLGGGDVVLETEPVTAGTGDGWGVGVVFEGLGDGCFVFVGETGVWDVHIFG
jgi:hypothetical protein